MPRRRNSGQQVAIADIGLPVLAFIVLTAIVRAIGTTNGIVIVGAAIFAIIAVVALLILRKRRQRAAWIAHLRNKYGDEEIVERILRHLYWQGQTAEQLRDSLGAPASVDGGLLKTRKREVWKYHPTGKNRYRLRITLDDDVVADHFQKN